VNRRSPRAQRFFLSVLRVLRVLLFKNFCVWPPVKSHGVRASRPWTAPISPEDLFEQEIAEGAEIFLPLLPSRLSAKPWFVSAVSEMN
jgi:hypothetical protein